LEVEGEHTIGREDQEFTLSDPEVSRRHALVRATASGITIEDAGSSNGTFVNGDRIAGTTELSDGDEVRVGQTTLSVEAPRTQATRISAAPPIDPGATVIRPSEEVATPAGAPEPSDYDAPQPDFVGESRTQPAYPGQDQPPSEEGAGAWQGTEPQYPPTEQQPAYGGPQGQGPAQYGQGYGSSPEQGAYAPPGQAGWGAGQQQAYGGPPGAYATGARKSKTWLWIVIAVVALAAIAAALYFFVF
jgi:hypothetical protein